MVPALVQCLSGLRASPLLLNFLRVPIDGTERAGRSPKCDPLLLLVFMQINNLLRLVHFYGHLSARGNIPKHATLGFEFKILLAS